MKLERIYCIFLFILATPAVFSRAVLQVGHLLHHLWSKHHHSTIVIVLINCNQENGFSDLLVRISPDVPESAEMLQQLKQILTKASASLYTATRWCFLMILMVMNLVRKRMRNLLSCFNNPWRQIMTKASTMILVMTCQPDWCWWNNFLLKDIRLYFNIVTK